MRHTNSLLKVNDTGYHFTSGRPKIKFKRMGLQIETDNDFIRNTEQHQLFKQFLHEQFLTVPL